MALDANILLQGRTPDLLSAVSGGLQLGQQIRMQPLREALMKAQAEQAQKQAMGIANLQRGQGAITTDPNTQVSSFQTPVFNPRTGRVEVVSTPIQGQLASRLGETPQQQSIRELDEAERKADIAAKGAASQVTEVGSSERVQSAINEGLDSTESVNDIGRAFELLKSVGTGKPQQTLLSAKQFFGIDAADEGELKSLLGRAVISNLRSSFGGNPTEGERAALAEIENSFAQQGEVNVRLLNRNLDKLDRRIERGISAAKKAEDDFALERLTSVRDQISTIRKLQRQENEISDKDLFDKYGISDAN